MLKNKKLLVGVAIILLGIGYLAFAGFRQSATYYYTVGEYLGKQSTLNDQSVRVTGQVVSGSVLQENAGRTLRFALSDGSNQIPVVYQGATPDAFREGTDVVLEGRLASGTFQATELLTKCPSKYEPEVTPAPGK